MALVLGVSALLLSALGPAATSASASPATIPLVAPAVPAAVAIEDPPIFPLGDIKVGQTGHGFTVYRSVLGPERFDFEVLGVMRGALGPGEDLIIARLIGDKIERTGVISGMSGSPAYIDGRLVGAVGYRFGSFTKDPIAGITPIERMLQSKDAPVKRVASRASARFGAPVPIATPLVVAGVRPEVLDAFGDKLKAHGYDVVPSAGGSVASAAEGPAARLYASGPVAGNIVSGDITMSGVGTVTWVKGNRFLAFGHSFQGLGVTQMPVSNAEIVVTVASDSGSWKMGQATSQVGYLTDDRLHAIAGTMGVTTPTVPVDITLDIQGPRQKSDAQSHVHIEVMKSKSETPLMTAIALSNALAGRINVEEGGTIDLTGRAVLSDGTVAPLQTRVAFEAGTAAYLITAISLLGELSELVENGLKDVSLQKVTLAVRRVEEVRDERVLSVVPLGALAPGTTLPIDIRTVNYLGVRKTRRMVAAIPRGLDEGKYTLVAAAPAAAANIEDEAGLLPQPLTFQKLMQRRAAAPPPGSLTVYLVRDHTRPRIEGESMAKMPAAYAGLLDGAGGNASGVTELNAVRLGRIGLDSQIGGRARTKVRVERHDD